MDVDSDYKEKAVRYWKSGMKGRLSFKNVKHKFKKLSSVP